MIYLLCIASFVGGWLVREWVAVMKLNRLLKENGITMPDPKAKEPEVPELAIKIEKHKDIFYIFESKTDKFLTQGSTRKECTENLTKDYPQFNIVADPNNINEVGFK